MGLHINKKDEAQYFEGKMAESDSKAMFCLKKIDDYSKRVRANLIHFENIITKVKKEDVVLEKDHKSSHSEKELLEDMEELFRLRKFLENKKNDAAIIKKILSLNSKLSFHKRRFVDELGRENYDLKKFTISSNSSLKIAEIINAKVSEFYTYVGIILKGDKAIIKKNKIPLTSLNDVFEEFKNYYGAFIKEVAEINNLWVSLKPFFSSFLIDFEEFEKACKYKSLLEKNPSLYPTFVGGIISSVKLLETSFPKFMEAYDNFFVKFFSIKRKISGVIKDESEAEESNLKIDKKVMEIIKDPSFHWRAA